MVEELVIHTSSNWDIWKFTEVILGQILPSGEPILENFHEAYRPGKW